MNMQGGQWDQYRVLRSDPERASRQRDLIIAIRRTTSGSGTWCEIAALTLLLDWLDTFLTDRPDARESRDYYVLRGVIGHVPTRINRQRLYAIVDTLAECGTVDGATIRAIVECAHHFRQRGVYAVAAHCYRVAMVWAERRADYSAIAVSVRFLAACQRMEGRIADAASTLLMGIELARVRGTPSDVARLRAALGRLRRDEGRLTDAEPLLEAAIDHAKVSGDSELTAQASHDIGTLRHLQAMREILPTRRRELLRRAMEAYAFAWTMAGTRVTQCRLLNDVARSLTAAGEYALSQSLLDLAYACALGVDTQWHTIINGIDLAIAKGDEMLCARYESLLDGTRLPEPLRAVFLTHVAEADVRFNRSTGHVARRKARKIALRLGLLSIEADLDCLSKGQLPFRPAPLVPMSLEMVHVAQDILATAPTPEYALGRAHRGARRQKRRPRE